MSNGPPQKGNLKTDDGLVEINADEANIVTANITNLNVGGGGGGTTTGISSANDVLINAGYPGFPNKKIKLTTDGIDRVNVSDTSLQILQTTTASSFDGTTGALGVAGDASLGGDLYLGGQIKTLNPAELFTLTTHLNTGTGTISQTQGGGNMVNLANSYTFDFLVQATFSGCTNASVYFKGFFPIENALVEKVISNLWVTGVPNPASLVCAVGSRNWVLTNTVTGNPILLNGSGFFSIYGTASLINVLAQLTNPTASLTNGTVTSTSLHNLYYETETNVTIFSLGLNFNYSGCTNASLSFNLPVNCVSDCYVTNVITNLTAPAGVKISGSNGNFINTVSGNNLLLNGAGNCWAYVTGFYFSNNGNSFTPNIIPINGGFTTITYGSGNSGNLYSSGAVSFVNCNLNASFTGGTVSGFSLNIPKLANGQDTVFKNDIGNIIPIVYETTDQSFVGLAGNLINLTGTGSLQMKFTHPFIIQSQPFSLTLKDLILTDQGYALTSAGPLMINANRSSYFQTIGNNIVTLTGTGNNPNISVGDTTGINNDTALFGMNIVGVGDSGNQITIGTKSNPNLFVINLDGSLGGYFKYKEGPWTPILTWLKSDANGNQIDVTANGGSVNVYTQTGYYIRNGGNVTIFYDVYYTVQGQYFGGLGGHALFIALRNIPFRCVNILGDNSFGNESVVSYKNYPNNVVNNDPFLPVFGVTAPPILRDLYCLKDYEEGFQEELFTYSFIDGVGLTPDDCGLHTYDGFQLPFFCNQTEYYVPQVAPPLFAYADTNVCQLNNAGMVDQPGHPTYTIKLKGQLTYYCGDN